jgi:hypothetical protein
MTWPVEGIKVGPGRCMGCGATVWWNGKRWRGDGPRRYQAHVCPSDRKECGAWMPIARERCARRPGHTESHRSRWVMDETARRRRGEGYCGPGLEGAQS